MVLGFLSGKTQKRKKNLKGTMFDWKEEVALYMQDTFLSLLTCADRCGDMCPFLSVFHGSWRWPFGLDPLIPLGLDLTNILELVIFMACMKADYN